MLQCAYHLFGVMGIHLAAEGLKVESFFGRHSNPEYRASGDLLRAQFGSAPWRLTVHYRTRFLQNRTIADADSSALKHLISNLRIHRLGLQRASQLFAATPEEGTSPHVHRDSGSCAASSSVRHADVDPFLPRHSGLQGRGHIAGVV